MARIDRTNRVDPSQADSYAEVGRRLLHAGRSIIEQGDARHASALCILAVHAAIAYADGVCVHMSGKKSRSADHGAVATLLRAVVGTRLTSTMEKTLSRLLAEKDRFEYQVYVATMAEAQKMFERAESFGAWCESTLTATRRSGS